MAHPSELLIERLQSLEYEIRRSITVREDQEDDVEPAHLWTARDCGISTAGLTSKGDLLSAVQTALRSARAAG